MLLQVLHERAVCIRGGASELKAVRDQLKAAVEATPKKLETITPIVSFLLEQSVGVIKNHHTDTPEGEANDESKKDK
ncbi:hypothetical protein GQ600_23687 [Phytophthora cactorum]|nr:hypothetical protein GQ600_23687 [Phytophthora cactorum]